MTSKEERLNQAKMMIAKAREKKETALYAKLPNGNHLR